MVSLSWISAVVACLGYGVGSVLQSRHQPAEHVHGIGEAPVRPERDGGGLVSRRQPAMRVGIDESDAGRWLGARRERLLAHRCEGIVLRQLEARYDGHVLRGVLTSVVHVRCGLGGWERVRPARPAELGPN